jgi:hypothetical protein
VHLRTPKLSLRQIQYRLSGLSKYGELQWRLKATRQASGRNHRPKSVGGAPPRNARATTAADRGRAALDWLHPCVTLPPGPDVPATARIVHAKHLERENCPPHGTR